jgi:flagellar motility protein MotE (MotC chaperone)
METTAFNLFKEYGLLGLMCGSVIFLLFLVVKWTLQTTKEIMNQSAKERECWRDTIEKVNKSIDDHSTQARMFHETVNDAHKFQRDEHKEMIKQLGEITITLGRINGYKHE